jgi:hypothetical protein
VYLPATEVRTLSATDRQYRIRQPVLTVAEEMDRAMEMMAVQGRSSQFVVCHKKWSENGWGKGWIKWESTPLYGFV